MQTTFIKYAKNPKLSKNSINLVAYRPTFPGGEFDSYQMTNPCSEHNQSNEQQATSASLITFPLQLRFSSHAFK